MEKIINKIFIAIVICMIAFPILLTNRKDDAVSMAERRELAKKPLILAQDGSLNPGFSNDYENWINDNIGMRDIFIQIDAITQYYVFNRFPDGDTYLGKNGDIMYASKDMIKDFQHLNLYSNKELQENCDNFRFVCEWFEKQGIQFYYMPCYDKHSIYPEQFMNDVNQYGQLSQRDQLITQLENRTEVKLIPIKQQLLEAKKEYSVYSSWGDATHWSQRGAYVGYCALIDTINKYNDEQYRKLTPEDYNITWEDVGNKYYNVLHKEDRMEVFTIREPQAIRQSDKKRMGAYAQDKRHVIYKNPHAGNQTKLLIVGDSYLADYILDDIAESFGETWIIWGDYTVEMADIVQRYQPDMIVYEYAERVGRVNEIAKLASILKGI